MDSVPQRFNPISGTSRRLTASNGGAAQPPSRSSRRLVSSPSIEDLIKQVGGVGFSYEQRELIEKIVGLDRLKRRMVHERKSRGAFCQACQFMILTELYRSDVCNSGKFSIYLLITTSVFLILSILSFDGYHPLNYSGTPF
jgi:hypothetical protein